VGPMTAGPTPLPPSRKALAWVRRHKLVTAIATVVVVFLLLGIIGAIIGPTPTPSTTRTAARPTATVTATATATVTPPTATASTAAASPTPTVTVTATATKSVPGPVRTVTVTRAVPGPTRTVVPQSCLDALDAGEQGFTYAGEALSAAGAGFTAAGNLDLAGVSAANDRMTATTRKLTALAPGWNGPKAECRASR
jgi:hypothetical protein